MPESKHAIFTDLAKLDAHEIQPAEYEEIPELTDEWFDNADLYAGDVLVRRGQARPSPAEPDRFVAVALDREIVERFRAGGPGWQSRINAALRAHLRGRE